VVGLFDRDVFLKLLCCDLWHEALAALGITHPYRMPSTTGIKSSERVIRRWLPDAAAADPAIARVVAVVQAVPVIEDAWVRGAEASPAYEQAANLENIDAGEAMLLGVLEALGDPNVLVTGDKRFIGALKAEMPARHAAVAGRILTLEQCLLAICKARGVAFVVARLLPAAGCDGSIRLALGSHQGANHAEVMNALTSMAGA
jgi:hypothetical protein